MKYRLGTDILSICDIKYFRLPTLCLYALVLCLTSMSTSWAFAQDITQIQIVPVVNEVVKVYGLSYVFYPFEVPSHALNVRIIGGYDVAGGSEPAIELRIIEQESCPFSNGSMLGCTKYFEKVVKSFGVVEIPLPPGKKYLIIFDNRHGDITDFKQIIAKFDLYYEISESYGLREASLLELNHRIISEVSS